MREFRECPKALKIIFAAQIAFVLASLVWLFGR
ncbi:MAG: hypothetical protein DDT21_00344 [Syntrophomonadaceae bacterium]|nr:hypothetical protein [Bacillota bacterium]